MTFRPCVNFVFMSGLNINYVCNKLKVFSLLNGRKRVRENLLPKKNGMEYIIEKVRQRDMIMQERRQLRAKE